MRASRVLALAALGGAAAVAACSNGGGGGRSCPALIIAPPILLYPIPGSTGVADAVGELVLTNAFANGGTFALVPQTGPTVLPSGSLEIPPPSPLPSPIATTYPSATLEALPLPTLAPAQTYTVTFTPKGGGPCGPVQAGGTLGSFTTQ